ncbi:hypothetical protein DB88DRAFT_163119 [Papiliotrema laurentii]|uniref:Uncharacterized protein n=1 Tax=Papiliotrema laurentii TaxID=5418 RepID=A0AAD9L7R0_PAPLA|nr:hypothetical protein DB88DRAFT_163119 [Papiliotrema laurentii]
MAGGGGFNPVFKPALPGRTHRFLASAIGGTMWFWMMYRIRQVRRLPRLARLETSVGRPKRSRTRRPRRRSRRTPLAQEQREADKTTTAFLYHINPHIAKHACTYGQIFQKSSHLRDLIQSASALALRHPLHG